FITSLGERQFLNLQEDAPKGEGSDAGWPRYSFMLLERAEEDELVFAGVNVQAFREAVEAGDLVGDVRVDRVVVDEAGNDQPQGTHVLLRDKAAMDAFLARAPLDTLFNREEPLHL